MTKALPQIAETTGSAPAPYNGIPAPSTRTAALTGYLANNLEPIPGSFRRYASSAACAPTGEQREMLLARRAELDAGLTGCDDATIRECIGMLRAVMASQQLGPDALQLARAAFIQVLGQYPSWAVKEACNRFLDGRAGNGTYAPTPAEIAPICRTLTADALGERAQINTILDAEVYALPSEEDRKRVAEMHERFVAETAERARRAKAAMDSPRSDTTPAERQKLAAELEERRRKREAAEAQGSVKDQLDATPAADAEDAA
jgi:hypothetical protein